MEEGPSKWRVGDGMGLIRSAVEKGREGNEGEIYVKSGKLPFLLTFDYFLNTIIMSEIIQSELLI